MANTRNKVAIVFDGVVCRVRTPVRTVLNKHFVILVYFVVKNCHKNKGCELI
ncbi:MAG: hypothetical protein FWH14_05670 [Oscillospiraceae bacterium]|nr:hypothetical protein [Oscillospiraceae bacterium]